LEVPFLGPFNNCEFCSGTGRKPDIVGGLVKAVDVRPFTMIVPDNPVPDLSNSE
jgi:hypothetical protein